MNTKWNNKMGLLVVLAIFIAGTVGSVLAVCTTSWFAGSNVPPAALVRSVGAYFPANGRFYAMGGRSADTAGNDFTRPFEYDPVTNLWTTKTATYPDTGVNNMVCAVLAAAGTPQIYCVGGSAAGATTSASRVFSYNPVTDAITALPAADNWPGNTGGTILPGGFAVVNNKLYIIGGFNISTAMTAGTWQFDPNAASGSRWLQRADLPQQRGYVPAVNIGGIIYTAGGALWDGTTLVDAADSFKYDPVANTWTAITNIPRATGETRAVVVNNEMWVLGGGRTAPNPSNVVNVYSPATNSWTLGPAFAANRRNFAADSDGTRVFLAGGYNTVGTTTTLLNTMEISPGCSSAKSRADFDGDGLTDLSVFRPSEGNWYVQRSTLGTSVQKFGIATDVIVPGDFDGDGKADYAVFRADANNANPDFYVLNSGTNTLSGASWGTTSDIPVSGDYNGDGKTDFAVFRPSNSTWYILNSGSPTNTVAPFGLPGDIPLAIDSDGDGKTNLAIFRPSSNTWYIARATGVPAQNFDAIPFGLANDILVPADYDGDKKDDLAIFRPSTGQWIIRRSLTGTSTFTTFGTSGDVPVPGDYDGDGKNDLAIYRNGTWYINRSTSGLSIQYFGLASDKPVPKAYIP